MAKITSFFKRLDDYEDEDSNESLRYEDDSSSADECEQVPPKRRREEVGNKHRQSGYDPKWKEKYPWIIYVEGEGLYCKWCQKHNAVARNKQGTWTTKPCVN